MFYGCSCNNVTPVIDEKSAVTKPIWSTELPGEAGVYNDGLIGLPVYEDKILFHSTFFTNLYDEDNRIHALNIHTGKLEWTFPENFNNSNQMFFWGVPYLYEDMLVMKMPKFGNFTQYDRIICLSLKNHEIQWSINFPENLSFATCRDVAGIGDNFYFMQESENNALILKGNVANGDIDTLFTVRGDNEINRVEITTNNALLEVIDGKIMMIFATSEKMLTFNGEETKSYLNILDIESKKIITKISVDNDEYYVVSNAKIANGKVYFTSGRKCFCINPANGIQLWEFVSPEHVNFTAASILVQHNIVFLWGDNRYIGLDATTGEKRYQGDIECGNAEVNNGYVYIVSRDGKLYILNIKDGSQIAKIICPDKYFLTGCKPRVYENKLFVFDDHHAYCYEAVPD
jgi:outer membrane protein assembly factor BamB